MKSTKFKAPKNGPVEALYFAAREIIEKTRKVFIAHGKDAREMRIPILIHGTAMRITIEDGPKVAARNAIEEAQSKATGKPAEPIVDMNQALANAMTLLEADAESLKSSHTIRGEWPACEIEAKVQYARYLDAIRGLRELERLL